MGAVSYTLANFFILAGWVLLLVATISAPVVDKISFLNITNGGSTTSFGVFGYCQDAQSGQCSSRALGYSLASIAGSAGNDPSYVNTSVDRATKALVLHPIAAGIAFIAQIIALASHRFGFLFASLIVLFAFFVSLAAMALDFALFGIVRHAINNPGNNSKVIVGGNTGNGTASYSTATWLVMGATISLLIAVLFTLFACCCGGDRRRGTTKGAYGNGYADGGAYAAGSEPAYAAGNEPGMVQTGYAPTRQHWWSRRNRY